MSNFHLVNPNTFDNLGFLERTTVGATALFITAILFLVGFFLLKNVGIPFFNSYYGMSDVVRFGFGVTSTIAGFVMLVMFINFIAVLIISALVAFFVIYNL
ncbi:hypothetical protein [Enterococcus sp. AZ103]|uniref:hypothetical protein n=1 Tax=Enterococcus sp. AZ103 TaxID=2774628 RepID=UPI003F2735F3